MELYASYIYYWFLQDFVYPENVAYPMGGPGSARFLVVEMHYNNPQLRGGNSSQFSFVCLQSPLRRQGIPCLNLGSWTFYRCDWQFWYSVFLHQHTTPAWCWNFDSWPFCEQAHDCSSKCWKLLYCSTVLCGMHQRGMEDNFLLAVVYGLGYG